MLLYRYSAGEGAQFRRIAKFRAKSVDNPMKIAQILIEDAY
jgi:hypothetical protein